MYLQIFASSFTQRSCPCSHETGSWFLLHCSSLSSIQAKKATASANGTTLTTPLGIKTELKVEITPKTDSPKINTPKKEPISPSPRKEPTPSPAARKESTPTVVKIEARTEVSPVKRKSTKIDSDDEEDNIPLVSEVQVRCSCLFDFFQAKKAKNQALEKSQLAARAAVDKKNVPPVKPSPSTQKLATPPTKKPASTPLPSNAKKVKVPPKKESKPIVNSSSSKETGGKRKKKEEEEDIWRW